MLPLDNIHGFRPVRRRAGQLEVSRRGKQLREAFAHDSVVVGDDDPDHHSGTSTQRPCPRPARPRV